MKFFSTFTIPEEVWPQIVARVVDLFTEPLRVPSASQPGVWHRVGFGCSCDGWRFRMKCRHMDAFKRTVKSRATEAFK